MRLLRWPRCIQSVSLAVAIAAVSGCAVESPPSPPSVTKSYRRPSAVIGYERASLGPMGGRRGIDLGLQYPPVETEPHPEIERFIADFRGPRRSCLKEAQPRRARYAPAIEEVLSRYGLPRELQYIAFIESRFNPSARSRDGSTVGMWQLSAPTARNYGLRIERRRDERVDAKKSTEAAVRFLAGLYDSFGDWGLAIAAYNSGPVRVKRAVEEGGTRDVFQLFARGLLSQTNREFVAKFFALQHLSQFWDAYELPELGPLNE